GAGRQRYCDLAIMYSTAAFNVASSALVAPRGGMAPLPLSVISIMASMPFSIRVAHAELSPSLGAPATPAMWQARQADLYSFSPAGSMVPPAADARAGISPATSMAADANFTERLNIKISPLRYVHIGPSRFTSL